MNRKPALLLPSGEDNVMDLLDQAIVNDNSSI
jgi:hypothetical protein